MRPPPNNRNVPSSVWDAAVREHEEYLELYRTLRGLGLDDAAADRYLDAVEKLDRAVSLLQPGEVDFRHDDHTQHFADAASALATMCRLLGYQPQPKLERATHEPWGAQGLPDEVLESAFGELFPMNVALTMDRTTMLLVDSVDYYQITRLDKAGAVRLADYFRDLASEMDEGGFRPVVEGNHQSIAEATLRQLQRLGPEVEAGRQELIQQLAITMVRACASDHLAPRGLLYLPNIAIYEDAFELLQREGIFRPVHGPYFEVVRPVPAWLEAWV